MMLIGFTGKAESGKSTACSMVESAFPETTRINFKDALIAEMKLYFPDVIEELFKVYFDGIKLKEPDDLFNVKPRAFRALMRNFGTELRRSENTNYWVEKWKARVSYSPHDIIVTDDVRFLNEAEAVHDMGGTLIRIIRTDITDTGSHQSEAEMDKIIPDYTISVGKGEHHLLNEQLMDIIDSLSDGK